MPNIDVVVPCYNYGRFLPDCVSSILNQGVDVRVLVIDDASPDGSVAIARQLAAQDSRIKVISHEANRGHIATYNEGIDLATADYFMLLSADDLVAPQAFARAMKIMEERTQVAFTIGGDVWFDDSGAIPEMEAASEDVDWQITAGPEYIEDRCRNPLTYVATGTVIVRTSVQKQAGHYRPALPHTGDLEMFLRFASFGDVAATKAIQGYRRLHSTNMSTAYVTDRIIDLRHRLEAFESVFSNECARIEDAARLRRRARRSLAERAYWWGMREIARGSRKNGSELMRFAFSVLPSAAIIPPAGYLLRMEQPLGSKLADVAADALGLRRTGQLSGRSR
jgi:glycosyltransferase involved in cell wall biosynthesis